MLLHKRSQTSNLKNKRDIYLNLTFKSVMMYWNKVPNSVHSLSAPRDGSVVVFIFTIEHTDHQTETNTSSRPEKLADISKSVVSWDWSELLSAFLKIHEFPRKSNTGIINFLKTLW